LIFTGAPFTYEPARGNLLLDIIVSPGGVNPGATAFYAANNGNALGVFSRYQNFGVGDAGYGLVTQFDYSIAVIPEPSTLALAAFSISLVTFLRRGRCADVLLTSPQPSASKHSMRRALAAGERDLLDTGLTNAFEDAQGLMAGTEKQLTIVRLSPSRTRIRPSAHQILGG
jgi:hypothetical protein